MKPLPRIFTNSERGAFGCQRRWDLGYLAGLSPYRTPAPLKHGTLSHQMLGTWYMSKMGLTNFEVIERVAEPWLEARSAFADTLAERGDWEAAERVRVEDIQVAALASAMFMGYTARWLDVDMKHFDVIAVEPQMCRWLRRPQTDKPICDYVTIKGKRRKRRWAYGGGVDLLLRDRRDDRVWAMEHKNTAERDLLLFLRKALDFSPQTRGYTWALQDPVPELSDVGPIDVAGVIYNVLRKKVPSPVAPLKKTKKISRAKNIDTTADIYKSAIIHNGENIDTFKIEIARLERNLFFAREGVAFTGPEIADFERDMTELALQVIAASKPNAFHSRQFSMCQGATYGKCQFQDICLDDGDFARADFTVKGVRHVELRGDMAEPWVAQERGLTLADTGAQLVVPETGGHLIDAAPDFDFEADPLLSLID